MFRFGVSRSEIWESWLEPQVLNGAGSITEGSVAAPLKLEICGSTAEVFSRTAEVFSRTAEVFAVPLKSLAVLWQYR